jgi:hypothetical protein
MRVGWGVIDITQLSDRPKVILGKTGKATGAWADKIEIG